MNLQSLHDFLIVLALLGVTVLSWYGTIWCLIHKCGDVPIVFSEGGIKDKWP